MVESVHVIYEIVLMPEPIRIIWYLISFVIWIIIISLNPQYNKYGNSGRTGCAIWKNCNVKTKIHLFST